ncbi:MAG: ABC transporter substrate-binding protein [Gammaproteobacteria bacterium]|nr:ABC transporter substrate-binding protein [Gammaproteobacteria bacterium]MDE0410611.1 ABC transporter substrate-binding protein [Gammaproteobacteria bacterium]
MKKIYDKHGDGIQNDDPRLAIEFDPLFKGVLGTGINRRELLQVGGLAALGGGASALPMPTFAAKKKWDPVIKIGYIPITDAAALLIAHDQGYFKDEGIDSVKPTLIRGWSPLVEAFAAHRFNLTHMLIPIPVWMRYNNKYPIKITAWDHTNGSAVLVGKKSGINEPKDFGGKQFAVPYWYSIHNIVSQRIMKAAGIKPVIRPQSAKLAPDECNFLVLAPPSMPPALAAGTIDGYCVAEPFNALGELKAGGKVLRFTGDAWKGHPCCVVVMHEEDAMDPDRAAWAQGVHNAVVRAQILLAENRESMSEILSRDGKGYLPVPKEVVKRAMMFYDPAYYNNPPAIKHPEWDQNRIDFQAWPYRSATELVVSDLKETVVTGDARFLDTLTPEHVANDLVNYDFVKTALEANPKWRNDASVPKEGDPYIRSEVFVL